MLKSFNIVIEQLIMSKIKMKLEASLINSFDQLFYESLQYYHC